MTLSPTPASTESSDVNGSSGSDSDSGENEEVNICVIDADDLLENPHGVVEDIARVLVCLFRKGC